MTFMVWTRERIPTSIDYDHPREGSGLKIHGWHSRGYLPHFDPGQATQSLNLHLADSLPQKVLDRWNLELGELDDSAADRIRRQRIEAYLDQGYGSCYLKDPKIAEQMQTSLFHFDGERYRLHAWVVMPNHVHFMLTPMEGFYLSGILHSFKSYTSLKANRMLGREGSFWHEDYYDRKIRDVEHFQAARIYIENNPVKAKLCATPSDWPWSSAYHRKHFKDSEASDPT
jgi:REP element-mobilizing transposase RayT